MMGREDDIAAVAIFGQHIIDHPAPFQGIADFGAAWCEHIVEGRGCHFRRTQGTLLGQVEHELSRRFRASGIDEFERNAIDNTHRSAAFYFLGRQQQADGAVGQSRTEA